MKQTIDETNRRREKQQAYNKEQGITPTAIVKGKTSVLGSYSKQAESKAYIEPTTFNIVADPIIAHMSKPQLEKAIEKTRKSMYEAARRLEFPEAAQYRDELAKLKEFLLKI
jgi:excinuclease ABC subunit B